MSENDVASTNVPATRDEISSMGDLESAERLCSPMSRGRARLRSDVHIGPALGGPPRTGP